MTDSNATQVTKAAPGASDHEDDGLPRLGDVVNMRYELREVSDAGGPIVTYRAFDLEQSQPVLLRIVVGDALSDVALKSCLGRLRSVRGRGGPFLSPILDANEHNGRPYTIERWPRGTPLSMVLSAREKKAESFAPRELLPVLARLIDALSCIPRGYHHGEVRAERIWLDDAGLWLTGAYLLASLPESKRSRLIAEHGQIQGAFAPEQYRGISTDAADRWAVASLLVRALRGQADSLNPSDPCIPESVGRALAHYLQRDATKRPESLGLLLDEIAHVCGLPVPDVNADGSGATRLSSIPAPPLDDPMFQSLSQNAITQDELPLDWNDPQALRAPRVPNIGISQEMVSDVRDASDLDPRLVRAALDVRSDPEMPAVDKASQRLKDTEPGTRRTKNRSEDELEFEELEELTETSADITDKNEAIQTAVTPPTNALSSKPASKPAATPTSTPHSGTAQAPQALTATASGPSPVENASRIPEDNARAERKARLAETVVGLRPKRGAQAAPMSDFARGVLIIVAAVFLGLCIIGVGVWVAKERREDARNREIEQRLIEIQEGSDPQESAPTATDSEGTEPSRSTYENSGRAPE